MYFFDLYECCVTVICVSTAALEEFGFEVMIS